MWTIVTRIQTHFKRKGCASKTNFGRDGVSPSVICPEDLFISKIWDGDTPSLPQNKKRQAKFAGEPARFASNPPKSLAEKVKSRRKIDRFEEKSGENRDLAVLIKKRGKANRRSPRLNESRRA
jgi:hypothetical protein